MMRRSLIFFCILICLSKYFKANAVALELPKDTIERSTAAQAIDYLNNLEPIQPSSYWPNVDPKIFVENLKTFTIQPLAFYEGKTTNFCSYSALTYIPLTYNPLGFAKSMLALYENGEVQMHKVLLKPSKAVRLEAGLLKYKGALDINPAGQMWFLTLSDHFKGYLNIFNRRFDKGDENTFWASTNLAKFNRMLRKLFGTKMKTVGSDLIHPDVGNIYEYLKQQMQKGIVFLYLNNKDLYSKTHTRVIFKTPTHFVLLTSINRATDGNINFEYWDYGLKTTQTLSPSFLKRIIYGVTTWDYRKNG